MIASRRSFLVGLGAALVTAPAIVRVSSIMPVKQMIEVPEVSFIWEDCAALLQARLDAAEHDPARMVAQSLYATGAREMPLDELAARLDREGWKHREEVARAARPAAYVRYGVDDVIDARVLARG